MKLLLNIIKIILIMLAIADLFIWLAANGSGHNIPDETNNAFLISFLILVFLIGIIVWLVRYFDKPKKD